MADTSAARQLLLTRGAGPEQPAPATPGSPSARPRRPAPQPRLAHGPTSRSEEPQQCGRDRPQAGPAQGCCGPRAQPRGRPAALRWAGAVAQLQAAVPCPAPPAAASPAYIREGKPARPLPTGPGPPVPTAGRCNRPQRLLRAHLPPPARARPLRRRGRSPSLPQRLPPAPALRARPTAPLPPLSSAECAAPAPPYAPPPARAPSPARRRAPYRGSAAGGLGPARRRPHARGALNPIASPDSRPGSSCCRGREKGPPSHRHQ